MRNKVKKIMAGLVLGVALLSPVAALAQITRYAYAYEQLTVSSTAVGFTASKVKSTTTAINQANQVVFSVNCASGTTCILRYTIDGTTPTASVGLRALYGDTIKIDGYGNNTLFRGIRETSTDVKLDVAFLR